MLGYLREEMCSGSEAGSSVRLIDFVYHSTLGLRVIKKKRKTWGRASEGGSSPFNNMTILRVEAFAGVRIPSALTVSYKRIYSRKFCANAHS